MQNKPADITANRTKSELAITWHDGHQSTYSFTLLRSACPCAECRGGHDKMGAVPDAEVFSLPVEDSPRTQLVQLEAVGSYAITIQWQDGHHYGIYNWDYLRALCPCPICRP